MTFTQPGFALDAYEQRAKNCPASPPCASCRHVVALVGYARELETSYASLRREHAATLAEWGARIEGLTAERDAALARIPEYTTQERGPLHLDDSEDRE